MKKKPAKKSTNTKKKSAKKSTNAKKKPAKKSAKPQGSGRGSSPAAKKSTRTKKQSSSSTKAPSKSAQAASDPRFIAVANAFANDPEVTQGGMFGAASLRVNGKGFAMLTKRNQFVVKLAKDRVDALIAAGEGKHWDPGHGRAMKEWLDVNTEPSTWTALAKEARQYVGG